MTEDAHETDVAVPLLYGMREYLEADGTTTACKVTAGSGDFELGPDD